jgi:hypothetical protein
MFQARINNYGSSAKPLEKLAKKFERFKIVDRTVPLSSECPWHAGECELIEDAVAPSLSVMKRRLGDRRAPPRGL